MLKTSMLFSQKRTVLQQMDSGSSFPSLCCYILASILTTRMHYLVQAKNAQVFTFTHANHTTSHACFSLKMTCTFAAHQQCVRIEECPPARDGPTLSTVTSSSLLLKKGEVLLLQ